MTSEELDAWRVAASRLLCLRHVAENVPDATEDEVVRRIEAVSTTMRVPSVNTTLPQLSPHPCGARLDNATLLAPFVPSA